MVAGVVSEGGLKLDSLSTAAADSYFSFAAWTAVLALPLSLRFFHKFPKPDPGLGAIMGAGVGAGVGSVAFYLAGAAVAGFRGTRDFHAAELGQRIELVPSLEPGLGFAMAPLIATMAVWAAVFVYGTLPDEASDSEGMEP